MSKYFSFRSCDPQTQLSKSKCDSIFRNSRPCVRAKNCILTLIWVLELIRGGK